MSSIILPPTSNGNTLRMAFSGKMRSGKEEAMKYLNEKYFNNTSHVINFADPLYTLCQTIQTYCGFPIEKDRGLLQYIGTDYARSKNPNVWINRLFNDMEAFHFNYPVMIGDARFANELDACKARNIPIINIQASDEVRLSRGADKDKLNHASEQDMDTYDKYDFIIENNSTLQDFHDKLDVMFGDLLSLVTRVAPSYRPVGSPVTIELIGDVLGKMDIESGIRITTSGLYLPN